MGFGDGKTGTAWKKGTAPCWLKGGPIQAILGKRTQVWVQKFLNESDEHVSKAGGERFLI